MRWFGGPFVVDSMLSTDQPLCGKIFASALHVLYWWYSHMLFPGWWEGAQDWYVCIGQLLLIDLKNHWTSQNCKQNPKINTSIELKSLKIREHSELKELSARVWEIVDPINIGWPILNWISQLNCEAFKIRKHSV